MIQIEKTEITDEIVKKIATLSQLTLTDDEVQHYKHALGRILSSFATLNHYTLPDKEDEQPNLLLENISLSTGPAESSIDLKTFLKNVPKREGSFVCVPGILDQTT